MIIKKHTVIDKLFVFYLLIGAFLTYAGYMMISSDGGTAEGVLLFALGGFMVIGSLIIVPVSYVFDENGVRIHYLFLRDELYLWKNIHAIMQTYDSTGHIGSVFNLVFSRVYRIKGTPEGKLSRYMNGNIRKGFRTKRLIAKYWDGEIQGTFSYNRKQRRLRKEAEQTELSVDEARDTERSFRARIRELIPQYAAMAKELDICLNCRYVYVVDGYNELNSRPKKDYTYTLLAEIAREGETDENRIISVSIDLLYVRRGKKALRTIPNKDFEGELSSVMADVLAEIKENGIDAYCENVI